MAISQATKDSLAAAYYSGDINTVNNILASGNISASDLQQSFGFSPAEMGLLSGAGIAPAAAPAPAPAPEPSYYYDPGPVYTPAPAPAPTPAPVAAPAPVTTTAAASTPSYTTQQIVDAYRATVGTGLLSEADFVNAAIGQYGVTANDLAAARNALLSSTSAVAPAVAPNFSTTAGAVVGPSAPSPFVLGSTNIFSIEQRTIPVGDTERTGLFIRGTNIELEPQRTETFLNENDSRVDLTGYTVYDPEKQGVHQYSPTGQYLGFTSAPRETNIFKDVIKQSAPAWLPILGYYGAGLLGGGAQSVAAGDIAFAAADAAQLAAQGLSEAQIAQTLATTGLDAFVAADMAQLAAQGLGASQIASTVGATAAGTGGGLFGNLSPAATVAQGVAQFPNAAGAANVAQAAMQPPAAITTAPAAATPTTPAAATTPSATTPAAAAAPATAATATAPAAAASTLPAGAAVTAPAASNLSGLLSGALTSQLPDILQALLGLGLLGSGIKAGTGAGSGAKTNVPFVAPTQGVPQPSSDYYNAIQQYYNAYLPSTPRDVATPLQQWYESKFGA